jgi:nucleotide-binding universal stress UspA family protein
MKSFPDTILCTTDFSEHSTNAFRYSSFLSSLFQAQLYLFHSIHFPPDQIHSSDVFVKSQKMKMLEVAAKNQMDRFRSQTDRAVHFESLIHFGDPVESLATVIKDYHIDLVVSGSRGFTALQRVVMGSVIERLARNLSCPVLVVPKNSALPVAIKKVAVCSNGPGDSETVPGTALRIAEATEAQVHIIQVLGAPIDEEALDETSLSYETAQSEAEIHLGRNLVAMFTRLGAKPERIVPVIRHGNAGEQIIPYLLDHKIDLLVVGVRHRTRLGKLLVGSTTEALLRNCRCPVLTVPVATQTPLP